jgi:SAM-dependent methyltransferase
MPRKGADGGFVFVFKAPAAPKPVRTLLVAAVGAALAAVVAALARRRHLKRLAAAASGHAPAPAAAKGAAGADGARAAVDRALECAYGRAADVLPPDLSDAAVHLAAALDFHAAVAALAERHCAALRDFTGERGEPAALDLAAGVGATAFALARAFPAVIAVEAAHPLLNAARTLRERGWIRYSSAEEGDLRVERTAAVPGDVDRARVHFVATADPAALPADLPAPFDAVVAVQLLCRLADPAAFVAEQLPALVRPGGVAVLASAWDWREDVTPRARWLGGYRDSQGAEVRSGAALAAAMAPRFELLETRELPFLAAREHRRRLSLGVAEVTVWKRR